MTRQSFVDHLRGTAAVSVLIVLPFAQLFSIRIAPPFVAFAVLACVIASLLNKKNGEALLGRPRLSASNSRVLAGLTFSILAYATLSLGWGLDPERGVLRIVTVLAAVLAAWYLATQFGKIPFERLPIVFQMGVAASVICLFVGLVFTKEMQPFTQVDYQRYDFNRIAVTLCLLIWPLLLFTRRHSLYLMFSILIIATAGLGVFLSESETAKVGLVAGSVTAAMIFLFPKLKIIMGLALGTVALGMPFFLPLVEMAKNALPQSLVQQSHAFHRLQIWNGASDLALEKWAFGWGMKSDRVLGLSGRMGTYTKDAGFDDAIIAPHNFALELWINVGLVGMFLIAAVLVFTSQQEWHDRLTTSAACALIVSTVTMLSVGVGSTGFQGWFIFALTIVVAAFTALNHKQRENLISRREPA